MGTRNLAKRIEKTGKGGSLSAYHTSVLTDEVVAYLEPTAGKKFIDATVGGGGHALELTSRGAQVLGLDRDRDAIKYLEDLNLKNLITVHDNFSHIYKVALELNFTEVDGILFDLGVSSHQIDSPQRGFSFQKTGPLDMRMDTTLPISAHDLVNNLEKRRLNEIFQNYGEEKLGLAIADAICFSRQIKPIETTQELAQIVHEVYRKKGYKTKLHEATKVFQALRIVVNSELLNLEEALPQTIPLLRRNGRLVVISFHSLEDGIVKRFLKENDQLQTLTRLPIGPKGEEVSVNSRARSARLRAAEKNET